MRGVIATCIVVLSVVLSPMLADAAEPGEVVAVGSGIAVVGLTVGSLFSNATLINRGTGSVTMGRIGIASGLFSMVLGSAFTLASSDETGRAVGVGLLTVGGASAVIGYKSAKSGKNVSMNRLAIGPYTAQEKEGRVFGIAFAVPF